MPMGNARGPQCQDPMTGRRAGRCAGFDVPGYMNCRAGFGFRWGCGGGRGGRGWRHWFYATGLTGWQRAAAGWPAWGQPAAPPQMPPTVEVEYLRHQASFLERILDGIRQRIEQLTSKEKSAQADTADNA